MDIIAEFTPWVVGVAAWCWYCYRSAKHAIRITNHRNADHE